MKYTLSIDQGNDTDKTVSLLSKYVNNKLYALEHHIFNYKLSKEEVEELKEEMSRKYEGFEIKCLINK